MAFGLISSPVVGQGGVSLQKDVSDEVRRRKEARASQSVNLPRFLQLSMKLLEIHHLEWSINSV